MPDLTRVTRTIRSAVRSLQHPDRHIECRHCGTNLECPEATCPYCEQGAATTYEFD